MTDDTVPETDKSGEVCSMRKRVEKKTDGRTIIFYSFAPASETDYEAKNVTELNTSKLKT